MSLSNSEERIATLLASGLKPSQVSSIVGLTPARIAQLQSREDFALILASKMSEAYTVDVEEQALSAKYLAAEHNLIQQINELAPLSEMRDVTAALRVIAERGIAIKKLAAPIPLQGYSQHTTVVQVSLPYQVLKSPTVLLSPSSNEVVGINDLGLAPMPSTSVVSLFAKTKERLLTSTADALILDPSTNEGEHYVSSPSTGFSEGSNQQAFQQDLFA